MALTREGRRRAAPTCAHRSSAKRWSTRAESAGDRPGLGGRRSDPSGAPRRRALHMLRQHTSVPRTLAHDDVWTTPPHPRPRQEREARLAPSVSSSAKRTTSSTSPPPRGNARSYRGGGQHVGARARSAPAFGTERVARGSDPAATGARARSAHAIGAERVTRSDAGSHARSGCPTVPPAPTCTTGRLLPSSATLSKKDHQPWPLPHKTHDRGKPAQL